jgi:hypothetical protein
MSCDVSFTRQDIQDIFDDQDRIATVIMLELSIEIELAEIDWLSLENFHTFIRGEHHGAGALDARVDALRME